MIAIEVNWSAFDPSESATQNSSSPERFDRNTTRRPSAVRLGVRSLRVDAIATAGGESAGAPGRAVSMRHTFESAKLRTYTSRCPPPGTRDTTGVRTVLTDEWQPARSAALRCVESPKPASGREQDFTAVGDPGGLACVQSRRQTHRIAFGFVRVLQREPVELTAPWRGVPAKDQHPSVR